MAVKIRGEGIEAVIEERGAELVSLADTTTGKEALWSGDPLYWARRSPILFPIVGRLKRDEYAVCGKPYTMNQHGFARDSVFNIIEKHSDKAVFLLKSTGETLSKYPFHFSLAVTYELKDGSLLAGAAIKNEGDGPMPFSIGFHPGFKCPFEDGDKLGDYALFFESPEECERLVLESGLVAGNEFLSLSGGVIALSEELFERDALILKGLKSQKVTLGRIDESGRKIEVAFPGIPYLGIWKKKDAPFVCIEPWHGVHDRKEAGGDIFSKEGIIVLPQNAEFSTSFTVSIL
ncbi:MAG TPA: aldose 1-epimerase family protein [Acidobacteriota bacterium]|nr:aldose 1-epimerase family protein [Acidobacteriota bacterium]HNT17686.1 aldose 1-epimerase family protein [Acidobacteriota bacterium]HPA27169.1 aldose 1-epimerase family protein [Acidobacteriota bacterium]HQO20170.1 aldose 1-epimerase family protein [Acidobacteriota bacterium]HQQ47172.1 aldose 1-epimerase family protein [Acidobacteriota bacterium]